MQENNIEYLDKAFPDGYVIVYTNPNSTIRMSYLNPQKYKSLFDVVDAVKNVFESNGYE